MYISEKRLEISIIRIPGGLIIFYYQLRVKLNQKDATQVERIVKVLLGRLCLRLLPHD
jgi:hypothetical protein